MTSVKGLLKGVRRFFAAALFQRPSAAQKLDVEKLKRQVWDEAIEKTKLEILKSTNLTEDDVVLKKIAFLKRQFPDSCNFLETELTKPGIGEAQQINQAPPLLRDEVIFGIRLILNREPEGEAEIAELGRKKTILALRRELIQKLHDKSPVFGGESFFKEYRAPLFLLAAPEKDIDWRLMPPDLKDPVSQLCTYGQIMSEEYAYICKEMKVTPRPHRKQWEFVWITAAFKKAGILQPGRRLVGFGCGREKLPSFFASNGVEVLATDAPPEIVSASWAKGQQYSDNVDALWKRNIIDYQTFRNLVSFQHVDMNNIPTELKEFDGCWSACALEHLGSLRHGLEFIENSLDCLKPGGFAFHTTEFNLSSNSETFENPRSSIFRKCDIEEILHKVKEQGHEAWPLNLHPGEKLLDEFIDLPPHSPLHLKVALRQFFVGTSIGIAIRKKL
jgi:2-polyprenyl-3-methyl-5-hydroxy-6-metoxy-1,4-benzoquinol methylase